MLELGGITDPEVRRALESLSLGVDQVNQFLFRGRGVPTFTPPGRAVYLRLDGGGSTTLYVWEGAAWAAK